MHVRLFTVYVCGGLPNVCGTNRCPNSLFLFALFACFVGCVQMPGVTVKDVDQASVTKAVSVFLKK